MGSFQYLSQILLGQLRSNTRVINGSEFPLWLKLKDEKGLKSHAEVITFLQADNLT